MNYRVIVIALSLMCLISCKPDQSGRLIPDLDQRTHDDSVRQKAEKEMKFKLETRFSLLDSVAGFEKEVTSIGLKLHGIESELELQKGKLAGLMEFKLFRSENKHKEQISEQKRVINVLEDDLIKFNDLKMNLQIRLEYFENEIRRTREE